MASGLILLEGWESLGSTGDRYLITNQPHVISSTYSRWSGMKGLWSGYSRHVRFQLSGQYSHLIVGVAVKDVDTAGGAGGGFLRFVDEDTNTTQGSVVYSGTSLNYYRGNGSTLLGTSASFTWNNGIWNYLEVRVKFDNSVGEVEIRVNGVQVLNLTSQDTAQSANSYATEVQFGNSLAMDDHYIVDKTVGGADFLGDVKVVSLLPTGDDTINWSRSTGANSYELVDENDINQDTDYVYTTSTTSDLYTMADLSGTPTIKGVEVVSTAKRDSSGSANLRNIIKVSGTTSTGATTALGTDYGPVRHVFENPPGSTAAWSYTDVNSLLAGVDRTG